MTKKQKKIMLYLKEVKSLIKQRSVKLRVLNKALEDKKKIHNNYQIDLKKIKTSNTFEFTLYNFFIREIKLTAEIERIEKEIQNRECLIDALTNEDMKNIFIIRYIECRTWKEVMAILGMPSSTTFYFHQLGLTELYGLFKQKFKD